MWSTRDVLLVTATVAILAVVLTILANKKLNSIVNSRVNEKSLGISPMLSVLGKMNDPGHTSSPPIVPVNNTSESRVESLPESLVPEPMYVSPKIEEAPQGSGVKWTPL